MSFNKIKNFIIQNKILLLFFTALIFSLFPEFAFANPNSEEDAILTVINFFIAWVGIILAIFTSLVWWFLTPEWTSGSAIWFWDKLKDLWILVSNVVYTIFAIILIFIAFMNIIWKWENSWELKQAIPKFIVWVLIVPFSWFIVSAFIWLSSILTVSILTIPYDNFKDEYEILNEIPFCSEFEYNFTWDSSSEKVPISCPNKNTTFWEFITNWDNVFGIVSIYTYGIMKLDQNWKLFEWDTQSIKKLSDLTATMVINLLFIVVFFILMVALLMALFVRWIYIWVFTVLSPLFGLLYFFGDKTPEWLKKFTFSKFIWLVMMPVYVAAALSFGLLFIVVAWKSFEDNKTDCGWKNQFCVNVEWESSSIEFLWTTHIFKWTFSDAWNNAKEALAWFKWGLWTIILQVFWLVVLWIAIMSALKSSELTQEVIKPIESFWNSVWQLAMKAPTYAPIIPAPWWWTMSATALGSFGTQTYSTINSKFTNKGSQAASSLFNPDDTTKLVNQLKNSVANSNDATADMFRTDILPALKLLDNRDINSSQYNEIIRELTRKWFLKDYNVSYWDRMRDDSRDRLYNNINENTWSTYKSIMWWSTQWFRDIISSDNQNSNTANQPQNNSQNLVINMWNNTAVLNWLRNIENNSINEDNSQIKEIANAINNEVNEDNKQDFINSLIEKIREANQETDDESAIDQNTAEKIAEVVADLKLN